MPEGSHRSGVVALLGPPNVGKSTLLNRLLGERLAIVTARPQTTRSRILGILTRDDAQLLLLDTPGLHKSEKALNLQLNEQVGEALRDCDLALVLIDLARGWSDAHDELLAGAREAATPFVLVGTKSDLRSAEESAWPESAAAEARALCRLSARTGDGVEALVATCSAALPEGPLLYADDELTNRPLRWIVGEYVREAFFEALGQELPYEMAAEVVEFDEGGQDRDVVRIRANLLVQRDSQKRIVIGRGGEMIKRIGSAARPKIEALLGRRVHLELWVRIEPRWQKSRKRVEALGYH